MTANYKIFGEVAPDGIGLSISSLQTARYEASCEVDCAVIVAEYFEEDIRAVGEVRLEAAEKEAETYEQSDLEVLSLARAIFDFGAQSELEDPDTKTLAETIITEFPQVRYMSRLLNKSGWGHRLVNAIGRVSTSKKY